MVSFSPSQVILLGGAFRIVGRDFRMYFHFQSPWFRPANFPERPASFFITGLTTSMSHRQPFPFSLVGQLLVVFPPVISFFFFSNPHHPYQGDSLF